jgi:hypothetical protein
MSAHEQPFACLLNEKAEDVHEADQLLADSINHLSAAMKNEPEKVYEYLEEAEARVEQLTRSLYSAMNTYTLINQRWT